MGYKSEEDVEHVFLLVDVLEDVLGLYEFGDVLLDVVLALALDGDECLALLLAEALAVLDGDDVGGLEAVGDELVHDVLAVGQVEVVVVLDALGNHGHLAGLVQLGEVDVGPAHDAHHRLALDQMPHFLQPRDRQRPRRLTYYPLRVELDYLLG